MAFDVLSLLCTASASSAWWLDLDHTLVNSSKYNEVEPELAARLQEQLSAEAMAGLDASQKGLHAMGHIGMWTKLRPGIREFLSAAAQSFELWIHTNGNRSGLAPLLDEMALNMIRTLKSSSGCVEWAGLLVTVFETMCWFCLSASDHLCNALQVVCNGHL